MFQTQWSSLISLIGNLEKQLKKPAPASGAARIQFPSYVLVLDCQTDSLIILLPQVINKMNI